MTLVPLAAVSQIAGLYGAAAVKCAIDAQHVLDHEVGSYGFLLWGAPGTWRVE